MQDLAGLWKQYMVEAQLAAEKSWDGGRVLQERHKQCLCTCQEEAQGNQGVPESVREEKISEELNEVGKIARASQTSLFHRNGMQTLWLCVGLSSSNQYHPTAHGTTLTPNSPAWGYEHAAAQTQGRSDSKCIERATFPQAFHSSLGKGKGWVNETSSGSTGRRHALAACWAGNASRTQSSAASRAQDRAARWRGLSGLCGTACRRHCSSSVQKGWIVHCSWDPRDKAKSCSSGSRETSAKSSTGL